MRGFEMTFLAKEAKNGRQPATEERELLNDDASRT
jgi:hypothetical protein